MKRRRFGFSLMMLACTSVFVLSSCEEDNPEPTTPTPTPEANAFFVKLDDAEFVETLYVGAEPTGSLVLCATRNNQTEAINITVPDTIAAGTYTFGGAFGDIRATYTVDSTADGTYAAENNTGTLVITQHDRDNDVIKGTFSFVATPYLGSSATDSHTLTEGSFVLNY